MKIKGKNENSGMAGMNFAKIILSLIVLAFLFGCNNITFSKGFNSYKFPHFDWQDHPAQFADMGKPFSYEIQIATDKAFSSIVDQDTIALSRFVHDQPFQEGNYFWRVRGITCTIQ